MSIARIKKNDTVIAIAGADKGKTGKVVSVNPKQGTAIVEGLRKVKKTVRRTEQQEGGIIEVEAPIQLSNLMPYDADKQCGSRIARTQNGETKVRTLKVSGKALD